MNKRNRDRWVFVLAALLLKQISMIVMLDTMFQHILAIQHPGTVQCDLFYALLYACFILLRNPRPHILLTKQHTYLDIFGSS
jgi:hypothetical protein